MTLGMLATQGLGAKVGGSRWLFRGLDVRIEPGTVTTVVGPNGSGKTTLLRCLAATRSPDEGTVLLDDRPLAEQPRRALARRLAYLPQSTALYHDLRVDELVMLGRAPHLPRLGRPSASDAERVRSALQRVDAADLGTRRMSTLSGGERQRVMLARMLATEAAILVLDEPTTALDIGHAIAVLELVGRLAAEGHAVVMAMHDLELARRHGDAAICLSGDGARPRCGGVVEILTPAVLGPVFGVHTELGIDGLVFRSRTADGSRT